MNRCFFRSAVCIKAGFTHQIAISVLFFMLAMMLISTTRAHAGRIDHQFWSPVPSFSGGVGLFLPVTPLSEDNLKYWVLPQIQQAKDSGLQFINLIVHWRDLEPRDNEFSFDLLGQYIQSIKSAGLQCVLRIYFNGGWHIQASPDWLFTEKNAAWCLEGNYLQPLPWDGVYIQEMQFFMETLS
ncbi:MAG: beta-galactosidase, partial [Desulfatirhabdiaceae bacterium]